MAPAMEDQGLRLYDGNSSVARDRGRRDRGGPDRLRRRLGRPCRGMPIGLVYESSEIEGALARFRDADDEFRCAVIPNTVGVVRGAPHPEEAKALVDFLISETSERLIMTSDSRNVPIRESASRAVRAPPRSRDPPGGQCESGGGCRQHRKPPVSSSAMSSAADCR